MKKLFNLLFEDEKTEDVLVPEEPPVVETKAEFKKVDLDEAPTTKVEAEKPKVVEKPKTEMKNRIDYDDISGVSKPKMTRVKPQQPTIEYEFRAPISPIFGILDSKNEQHQTKVATHAPQKPTSKTSAVISPIYGLGNNTEQLVVKNISKKESVENKVEEDFDNISIDEILSQHQSSPLEEKTMKNIEDEVIMNKNISLFDEEV